jgi:crossover junction endodeoxyribonuclease RuvC
MVAKKAQSKRYSALIQWCNRVSRNNNPIWVGIDPGLNGALAFISEDGDACVLSTPTISIIKNKKNRSEYNIMAMVVAIRSLQGKRVVVCQELTHAMPGNGNVSMYSFGRGHGLWEGIVLAHDLPLLFSMPQQWKKMYPSLFPSVKAKDSKEKQKFKAESKKEALKIAGSLFPSLANNFIKMSDDGKAEALLIANYCRSICRGRSALK